MASATAWQMPYQAARSERRREALLASGAGLLGAAAAGALLVLLLPGTSERPALVAPAAVPPTIELATVASTAVAGALSPTTTLLVTTPSVAPTTAPTTTAPPSTTPETVPGASTLASVPTSVVDEVSPPVAEPVWPILAHSGATAVPLADDGLLLTTAAGAGGGDTVVVQWGDADDLLATVVARGDGFTVLQLDRPLPQMTTVVLAESPPTPGSWVTVWSALRQRAVVVERDEGLALAGVAPGPAEFEGVPVIDQAGHLVGLCSHRRGTVTLLPVVGAQTVIAGRRQAAWLGVSVINGERDGQAVVSVSDVDVDGPAALAGLRAGDIVIGFDGQVVDSTLRLASLVEERQPGDAVTMAVQRGVEQLSIEVTLGARPFSL